MVHKASGTRAIAIGERSGQTGFVHCEHNHWWFGYAHYAPVKTDPKGFGPLRFAAAYCAALNDGPGSGEKPLGSIDHPIVGKLGPHFLDVSLEEFRGLLKGRRGAIKAFLLDQDRIAGIGNVYVQTPLWKAKIHPLRPIPSLSEEEVAALWQALREVLQGSIHAGGAPFELNLYGQKGGWDDPYLFHWEEGAPCTVCGTPLAKIRTGSTGSYICPGCQVLEPK